MKSIIKSTLLASTIAIGFKFLINQNPVNSIDATLEIPFLSYIEIKPINCVEIGVNWNIEDNMTTYSFSSRSISTKFAKKCINKGIKFVQNQLLIEEKKRVEFNSDVLNVYENIISEIEASDKIKDSTLILIEEYMQIFPKIKGYQFINSNLFNTRINSNIIESTLNISIYKNSWIYCLNAFLLSFWLFFVSFEYFKNEK